MNINISERVAVLGGGSFGTVLSNLTASNGVPTKLWVRREEQAAEINTTHRNANYFSDIELSSDLTATSCLNEAVKDATIVVIAVPSSAYDTVCTELESLISNDVLVISTAKGIRAKGFQVMSQVVEEYLPEHAVGVLSGPNLAKEIASGQYTATVVASKCPQLTKRVQTVLSSNRFRVYAGHDPVGAEFAGALKNIYAIVSGVAASMGMGNNTTSMIMTRSLAEMARFCDNHGAEPMTLMGLAGIGDLIVTCSSPLSRNYRVGLALGQGKTLEQAVSEIGQVAEGVKTLETVYFKAKEEGIRMPLVNGLYDLIYGKGCVETVIKQLMSGSHQNDVEYQVK